ncbi:MAG: DinB family protein [Pyrinomonadaceae bacterium]|nr:DinB family protein [Pyrinomonadaceae bacterium]
MTEIERITDQLRRAFEGDAWCGSALREVLADVTAESAARRMLANAHSVWEIVLHVAAWKDAVRRRLAGERVVTPAEGDFPSVVETDATAWRNAIEMLETRHTELREAVARLDDARLEEPIVEGMSSLYVTLHGAVQHDLYHAAQIALLKKG